MLKRRVDLPAGQQQALAGLLLLAAACGYSSPGTAAVAPQSIVLAHVNHAFNKDSVIGPRRAGLLCLPNGVVRWGDLNGGAKEDLLGMLANRLRTSGAAVKSVSGAGGEIRLHARIVNLRVKACAKKFGLRRPAALSGGGVIDIEWVQEADAKGFDRPLITHADFVFQPNSENAAPILDAAFSASAQQLLAQLTQP